MTVEPLPTPSAPHALGPYSHAVRAGDWVILAGQVPLDPESGAFVGGGVDDQARRVLTNIRAILGDCGLEMHDVAKSLIFLIDLADFAAVNAVYSEFFGDHRPARATVQISALPANARLEIEVWAYAGDR